MGCVHDTLEVLGLDADLVDWADGCGDDLERAWGECPRGDWLLRLALRVDIDRQLLVRTAAHCVAPLLKRLPRQERRPQLALAAAERWASGEGSAAECWAAAFAASAASKQTYGGTGPHADAAMAAACVAFACDAGADVAYYSERAYAANALFFAARASGEPTRTQWAFAAAVRGMIPFEAVQPRVEPAVRASSSMPPPVDPARQSHVRSADGGGAGGFAAESSPSFWFDPDTPA